MKFITEFTAESSVRFSDPEKAKTFFIDGDWKNTFYDLGDLEGLAEHISNNAVNSLWLQGFDKEKKKLCWLMEGIGYFYRDKKPDLCGSV